MKRSKRYAVYRELEQLATEIGLSVAGVIVEGPHDKKTLRFLGYHGPVILCSKTPPRILADYVSKRFATVVILTDFDDEGDGLCERISKLVRERGVEVKDCYRRDFQRLLSEVETSTIEGIFRLKLELFRQKR